MKFSDKKLLIFDLDGTLIDSVPDLAISVNYMLSSLYLKIYSEDVIRFWVGNGAQTLVKRALSGKSEINQNLDDELYQKALEIFLKHYFLNLSNYTTLYPDVKETLWKLKRGGFILAVVTNKPYDFVEPILKSLEINELFELYLGGDSLKMKKPDPMPLLYVIEKLNMSVDNSVMIGDSKNDILAANNANIDSIALSYGYNYGEDISIYKPTFKFDNFKDILTPFGVVDE